MECIYQSTKLLLILISVGHCQYITTTTGSWRGMCDLGEVDITFQGQDIKVTTDLPGELNNGDSVWVDFVKEPTVLKFVGCKAIPITAGSKDVVDNPENCLYLCRDSGIIGLERIQGQGQVGTACYCLNKQPFERDDNCKVRCPNSHLRCGEEDEDAIAVYETADKETSRKVCGYRHWNGVGNDCLMSQRDNLKQWKKCQDVGNDSRTKASSVNTDSGPPNFPHTDSRRSINGAFWTRLTRVNAIHRLQDSFLVTTSNLRHYGYIYKKEDQLYLNFTNNSHERFRGLCKKDKHNDRSGHNSNNGTIDENGNGNETTDGISTNGTSNGVVAGYIAVAIVVLIVLALAVVILLVYWKRKRDMSKITNASILLEMNQPPAVDDDMMYHEIRDIDVHPTHYVTNDANAYTITQPTDNAGHEYQYIDQADLNTTTPPTYFVLEKQPKDSYVVVEPEVDSRTIPEPSSEVNATQPINDASYEYHYIDQADLNTTTSPTYFVLEKQPKDSYGMVEPEVDSRQEPGVDSRTIPGPCSEVNAYDKAFVGADDDSYDKIGQKKVPVEDKALYNSLTKDIDDTYDKTNAKKNAFNGNSEYSTLKGGINSP